MPLLLNDEDVRKLLTIEDTIEALEDAYDQYGRKLVRNPIRREMRTNSLSQEGPLTAQEYTWEKVSDRMEAALLDFVTVPAYRPSS